MRGVTSSLSDCEQHYDVVAGVLSRPNTRKGVLCRVTKALSPHMPRAQQQLGLQTKPKTLYCCQRKQAVQLMLMATAHDTHRQQ